MRKNIRDLKKEFIIIKEMYEDNKCMIRKNHLTPVKLRLILRLYNLSCEIPKRPDAKRLLQSVEEFRKEVGIKTELINRVICLCRERGIRWS